MSTQIAVRLPDELVSFIDDAVDKGKATSRADLVTRSLERERRRLLAELDIELLARSTSQPDDLDGLAEAASRTPLDDLD